MPTPNDTLTIPASKYAKDILFAGDHWTGTDVPSAFAPGTCNVSVDHPELAYVLARRADDGNGVLVTAVPIGTPPAGGNITVIVTVSANDAAIPGVALAPVICSFVFSGAAPTVPLATRILRFGTGTFDDIANAPANPQNGGSVTL